MRLEVTFVLLLTAVQTVLKTRPFSAAVITARPTSEHNRPDLSEKATRNTSESFKIPIQHQFFGLGFQTT